MVEVHGQDVDGLVSHLHADQGQLTLGLLPRLAHRARAHVEPAHHTHTSCMDGGMDARTDGWMDR